MASAEILSCLRSFLDLESIYREKRQLVGLESLRTWAPQNAKILLSMFGVEVYDVASQYKDSIIGNAILQNRPISAFGAQDVV